MKTFINLIAFIACIATAWAQETPAQTKREVVPNTAVILVQYPDSTLNFERRDSNNCLLFHYQFSAAQQVQLSDDEYTEQIDFTVIPDKTGKFVLSGKQLEAAQAYFYKGCYCADRGTFAIKSGTIKGTRMSKTEWYINLNVKVQTGRGDQKQTVTKKIKGLFKIVPTN